MQSVRETWLFAQNALVQQCHLSTDEARVDAQLLLQTAANVNRAWLISHADDALEANIHAVFQASLLRRLKGEPMAYILGHREFYGLDLLVTADTLIPRPDTETLVEAALGKIPPSDASQTASFRQNSAASDVEQEQQKTLDADFHRNTQFSILDLGTGSGAIALAIAKHRPQAMVTAIDASIGALDVAKKNATNLGIRNVVFVLSHWFESLNDENLNEKNNSSANFTSEKFDLIVSNPPYIELNDPHLTQGDLRFEPISALASGNDGLDDIRKIVDDCLIYLKPQGWLMLEHGHNQAEAVADLMANAGLVNIETLKDLGGNPRVTLAKNPLIVSTHWD